MNDSKLLSRNNHYLIVDSFSVLGSICYISRRREANFMPLVLLGDVMNLLIWNGTPVTSIHVGKSQDPLFFISPSMTVSKSDRL
jgi:hypothetical protein